MGAEGSMIEAAYGADVVGWWSHGAPRPTTATRRSGEATVAPHVGTTQPLTVLFCLLLLALYVPNVAKEEYNMRSV